MSDVSKVEIPPTTFPRFQKEAAEIALQMSQSSAGELERLLRVDPKITAENYKRYQDFHFEATRGLPVLLAYTGIVFRRFSPKDFSDEDFRYARDHLGLTSSCYRLLRPLDVIRPYRLEGDVRLSGPDTRTVFEYWKPIPTDLFIEDIKEAGGILYNLASDETRGLFDRKWVEREVHVATPEFYVWKDGESAVVMVCTKMSRGGITRYIPKNQIESVDQLKTFIWEGFEFNEQPSDKKKYASTNGKTE